MSPARRRGLGDVLHYFIPEEEQEAARARSRAPASGEQARWLLIAEPLRPLDRSLATDLAAALAAEGRPVRVIAPFSGPSSRPRAPSLRWCRVELPSGDGVDERVVPLGEAIRGVEPDAHVLAAVPPSYVSALLAWLGPGSLTGLLVPVDNGPWGLTESLSRLRQLAKAESRTRICVFLVGDISSGDDLAPLRQLEGAAARQLGLLVEEAGGVVRDEASYRALLLEAPVIELDPSAASSRSLHAIARRILGTSSSQAHPTP